MPDMQLTVPHLLLSRLSELLAMQMGLYYPEKRWSDLERGIAAAAPALRMGNTEACIHQLLSAPLTRKQIEILACHLTVGETYFFREKKCFDVLKEHIFPELISACAQANRQLRIWSAGCCTGEEPYSIAMLLDQLTQHSAEWNATILATDINPVFLQKAAEGVYGEWSFRDTPPGIKERYFKRRKNGKFEILPHIRKRVTFSYLNLTEDVYPSLIHGTHAMDMIFCRNVLMYFNPEVIKKIGQNFHRALGDGGWLIVSPVEVSNSLFPRFKAITFPGAVLYQKNKMPGSQTSMHECMASTQNPVPNNTLFMPVPASGQMSYFQDGETSFTLESAKAETLSAGVNVAAQPHKIRQVEAHPVHHERHNAHYDTARSHANLGKLAEAIEWCEKAIAADKLNPVNHYLLATLQQELGQGGLAAQSLLRTLYLDPDFVLAHFALANLCLSQGRAREAKRHFDNTLTLLHRFPPDALLPESEGLTAGGLIEIIHSLDRSHRTRPRGFERENNA